MKSIRLFGKARFVLLSVALMMNALLQTTPILAQTIQWKIVPGTGGVSAMTPQGSDPDLFGTNTVVRQGDRVNFDAEIDKQYVRYGGNCRTRQLFILRRGILNSNRQPYNVVSQSRGFWFTASEYQEKFLTKACKAKKK